MMLNKTGIFGGKVMGMEEVPENNISPEDEYELQQQRVLNENGLLRALQPINFQDKIMGGQNFQNNIEWKLPQISGALNYTQKVNMLTGKGVNKMEQEINAQNKINQILSSNNSNKKVEDMLGNNKTSKMNINNYFSSGGKKDIKIDNFFSSGGKNKMDINKFFSPGGKSNTKIDTLLGNRDKKKIGMKFDTSFGFGKRAFTGINTNQKINEVLSTKSNILKKNNIIQNQKNDALNKINNSFGMNNMFNNNIKKMFGTFENPEKIATRRLKQQKGLPMFGDFDGDKVINMLDCNPLDPTKQDEMKNVLSEYATGSVEDSEKIRPTTPDTMAAQRGFGTSPYNGPDPGNFGMDNIGADINNDGVIDKKDNEAFSELNINSQLQEMLTLMNKTNDPSQRQKYNQVYKKLLDTKKVFIEEAAKSKRSEGELEFKKSKFTTERLDNLAEKKNKQFVAGKQLELQKDRFDFEKDLTQQKFEEANKSNTFNQTRQLILDSQKNRLDVAKLKQQEQKGELALWENKLKAGSNMLGSLLGPGESLKGFQNVVGGINKTNSTGEGISKMTQMSNQGSGGEGISRMSSGVGSNPNSLMMMSGGLQQQKPFSVAAQELVGQPQQKSFAQKVNESISNKAPEELIEEQRMQQYTPQQNEQVIQQPIPQQQVPQQIPQQPIIYQQPQQEPDWERMTPQQIAQYDPEYAKYVAEAEAEGKTGYRRGPYKKRRF